MALWMATQSLQTVKNFYASTDNRDTKGGCFAGRDVHSNPNKDNDGVGTPEHLNAIGKMATKQCF